MQPPFTFSHAKQVTAGYGVSTVIFVASAFVAAPWRFVLLAFALIQEAGFTAAAPISEYVLRASGGNPSMAYGLTPAVICLRPSPCSPWRPG